MLLRIRIRGWTNRKIWRPLKSSDVDCAGRMKAKIRDDQTTSKAAPPPTDKKVRPKLELQGHRSASTVRRSKKVSFRCFLMFDLYGVFIKLFSPCTNEDGAAASSSIALISSLGSPGPCQEDRPPVYGHFKRVSEC